jgi:2-isopropylmalate synthase
MALRTHHPSLGLTTGVNTREIASTSRLVSMLSGYAVQPNKAVIGGNAFSHESGIHQHGVLMERTTYEIMNPEDIGLAGNKIVLGKHSGRHAFVSALEGLGIHLKDEQLEHAFARFKEMADRKVSLTDSDLIALGTADGADNTTTDAWAFQWLALAGGTDVQPRATVRLSRGDQVSEADATGDGLIDAACNAVANAAGVTATLVNFQVDALSEGTDAIGDVSVKVEVNGQRVNARGVSTDVVEASARAFLAAINKVLGGTAVARRTDKP